MSDEKKLSEQVRNCAYIVPDPHPTDTEAGEREVLGLNQVADEIAALEQRLAAAEAEKQRIVEMFIKEMCIVNPHSSVVCSRGIKGCVMQHTHLQAAEADQQRAIDAALENLAAAYKHYHNYTHACKECVTQAHEFIRSRIRTNPLAEAQARIAELEQELKVVRSMNPDADAIYRAITHDNVIKTASISIEQHSKQIADLTAQLAEAKKDAERYRWAVENAIIETSNFKHDGRDPASTKLPLDNAIDAAMRQEEE